MNWQIVAGIAGLIVAVYLLKRWFNRGGKLSRHPYQKHVTLFSADDRAFFRPLKQAVGEDFEIFGKLRAEDIIIPKKGTYLDADSPVVDRHFDFVLCDKTHLAVACVIQLYDKTRPGANEPDPLQAICENLGLPWVRFQVKADYPVDELREKLQQAMAKEPFYFTESDGRKEPRISNLDGMKF